MKVLFTSLLTYLACAVIAGGTIVVRQVELVEYAIPRTTAFTTAKGSSSMTPGIFIRITAASDAGTTFEAWGDALPRLNVTNESRTDAWTAAEQFSRHLLGKTLAGETSAADLETVELWMGELREAAARFPLTFSRPPLPHRQLRATQTGFEVALLGLVGQIHNKPLFAVLGEERDAVAIAGLTASLNISPEEGRERVSGARRDYRCLRLKIGVDFAADAVLLEAVADEIVRNRPDFEIFVDVNQGWGDAGTSIRELSRIREILKTSGFTGRFICEQPTAEDDFEALAQVTQVARFWAESDPFRILIMADEILWDMDDLRRLVELDAVDQVNFKIQKAGGLIETLRMGRYLAEAKPQWEVYVGGLLMTDVGAWANLHIGHALPRLDYMTGALARRTDVVNPATDPLRYRRGTRTLVAPSAPGLGTGVNLEALEPFISRSLTIQ